MTFEPVKNQQAIEAFGKHLRELRKQKGFSHQRLADEADVAKSTIIKIEQARINISLDIIISLSTALDVEPMQLLNFKAESGLE